MKNYGDLAFRIYGTIPRYTVNILQSIQLLCQVGLIIISNGQGATILMEGPSITMNEGALEVI